MDEREFPCDCHGTDAEHEAWFLKEREYWRRYFGLDGPLTAQVREILREI